jgi:hypothetical protein
LEDGIMPPVLGDVPLTSITPVVVPPVFGWVLDVPVTPLDRFWDPDAHAAVLPAALRCCHSPSRLRELRLEECPVTDGGIEQYAIVSGWALLHGATS